MARITTNHLNVRVGPGIQYLVRGQLYTGAEVPVVAISNDGEWLAIPDAGWVSWNEDRLTLDGDPGDLGSGTSVYYSLVGPAADGAPSTLVSPEHPGRGTIAEVVAGDLDAIAGRLRIRERECPVPFGIGEFPCPEGVADGSVIEAIQTTSGCEGTLALPDERMAVTRKWYSDARFGEPTHTPDSPPRLYAAWRLEDDSYRFVSAFANAVGLSMQLYPDGTVDVFPNDCEHWPANLLLPRGEDAEATRFEYLPPVPDALDVPPVDIQPLPLTTRLGDPAVDRLLEAILEGDIDTLMAAVLWEEVACSDERFPPRCGTGVAPGTPIPAIRVDNMEPSYASRDDVADSLRAIVEAADGPDYQLCFLGRGGISFRMVERARGNPAGGGMWDMGVGLRDGRIVHIDVLPEAGPVYWFTCRGVVR